MKAKRFLSRFLTVLLLLTGLLIVGPGRAGAVGPVDDYPDKWKLLARDAVLDDWREWNRECVSFVAWRLHSRNGFEWPFSGNAGDWQPRAVAAYGSQVSNRTPAVGSVAWWAPNPNIPGSVGHVAWVYSVDSVNHQITIEEYNYGHTPPNYTPDGTWDSRTISDTNPTYYLHLKDLGDPGGTPPSTNHPTGGGIASTSGSGRLYVAIQGTNTVGDNTFYNLSDNAPWGGWNLVQGSNRRIASQPAGVSWSNTRIDMFARGEDSTLLHKWFNATSGWSDWISMGSCILGAPTVTSWGPDRLDVFARGCNTTGQNLLHWWWDANHNWYSETMSDSSGIRIGDSPTATAWGIGRIDIFVRGEDGQEYHKWYDSSFGWSSLVWHAGCISGQPAVSSWAQFRLDVFIRDCGGSLWHNWYDGTSWYWEPLQGGNNYTVANFMGAVSCSSGRIDLFARSTGSDPIHKFYDGTSWSVWENLGGWAAG